MVYSLTLFPLFPLLTPHSGRCSENRSSNRIAFFIFCDIDGLAS